MLVALAVAGPASVALLRFFLPYWGADENPQMAAAVGADQGAQSTVLWLGLIAALTLVPGLLALWPSLPACRLRDVGFSLALVGYLCVPGLLVLDHVLYLGATANLPAETTAQLLDDVHLSALVQVGLFVPTHIIGLVLLGVLALRRRLIPTLVAWALIVSQPLHLAAVISGLPALDLLAWGLTALGVGWLAADRSVTTSRAAPLAEPTRSAA